VAGTIVCAVPDFEPAVGGTSSQVGLQARALQQRGYDVVVVTRRRHRSWARRDSRDGLLVRRFGLPGYGRLADKLSALAPAPWLLRSRGRIRVLVTVQWADSIFAAALAGLLPRTLVMWAARGDAGDALRPGGSRLRRAQVALRRRLAARCLHIALSPAMREELVDLGLERIAVVPVPIDAEAFRPPSAEERAEARRELGVGADELTIGYFGHLRALKAVDRLVEAFAGLLEDGARAQLLIVGGSRGAVDDVEGALREQVRRLGLGDSVRFCGHVPEVRTALWATDVFVLPSTREGMPVSLLEAMACGVACVAPPSAAGDELLAGGAGLVPPTNEPADLLDALRRLAADPDERARIGRAGLERAREFDIERVTDRLEELLGP
jgi:glycosyltransferase involved in cell wall biosynthesis